MTAIVLLSGGLDSATTLALARSEGYACHALTFDYGQRHRYELEAAARVAEALGAASHRIVEIDLAAYGGSALTADIPVPKGREPAAMAASIPVTYVPARNTIFLAYAVGYAEVLEATEIFLGVNAVDYSGYPDCRPAFIEAFERVANLGTKAGLEGRTLAIQAPLIRMTKAEIIRTGHRLGLDYGITHSCYDPGTNGAACRRCDACLLRAAGFRDAELQDPAS
jgi:7-cyano-7-deazaguanine synthase